MKKIIPYINAENELNESVIKKAIAYENSGADELFIYNYSGVETEQEEFLQVVKDIVKKVDLPVMIGCFVRRFEDVKKASYTGAEKVVIPYCKLENKNVIKEAIERFGNEKITIEFDASLEKNDGMLRGTELLNQMRENGVTSILIKHITLSTAMVEKIEHTNMNIYIRDSLLRNDLESLLKITNVTGVATDYLENKDIMRLKRILKEEGIDTDTFESSIDFSEFKKDTNGLVPVIVQDYKTKEVLMLAYMNEEAYNTTIATGKMTYYSRSRSELWIKGETSGHYQYVRSLHLDCDKDTILANVLQIGVACHTGSRSCFFRELMKKEYDDTNPLTVFQEVFDVILDRREHPKEGSYTNYLFDKGIDKILKKCGEEATEIVIAAKNPNAEELKYEISDFLYHMMVLMVQCGLGWDDVITELSHRR